MISSHSQFGSEDEFSEEGDGEDSDEDEEAGDSEAEESAPKGGKRKAGAEPKADAKGKGKATAPAKKPRRSEFSLFPFPEILSRDEKLTSHALLQRDLASKSNTNKRQSLSRRLKWMLGREEAGFRMLYFTDFLLLPSDLSSSLLRNNSSLSHYAIFLLQSNGICFALPHTLRRFGIGSRSPLMGFHRFLLLFYYLTRHDLDGNDEAIHCVSTRD